MTMQGCSKLLSSSRVIIVGIVCICIAGGVFAKANHGDKQKSIKSESLPSVALSKVTDTKNVSSISAIGTVKAAQGIDVSAPTSGIITSIHFESGQSVKAGELLVTLKNDDLKSTVLEDKAKYQLAEANEERSKKLVKRGFVSQQDADQTASSEKQAQAQLDHDEALLKNTIIEAPFPGRLGISQVDLGQYVTAGQVIASLQDRSKMYVDFYIPEKQSDLAQVGDSVILTSHQGESHQWSGKIIALGSKMNDDTRSLPVRAIINKPYNNLTPGMYVDVSVVLPNSVNATAIPQGAVVYNPYGDFVYVYKNGEVIQRYITTGEKIGGLVIVVKGLSLGEKIVTEGQQKLFNHAKVEVVGN